MNDCDYVERISSILFAYRAPQMEVEKPLMLCLLKVIVSKPIYLLGLLLVYSGSLHVWLELLHRLTVI